MNTDNSPIHSTPSAKTEEVATENIINPIHQIDLSRVPKQVFMKHLAPIIRKKYEKTQETKNVFLSQKEIDSLVEKRANEVTSKKYLVKENTEALKNIEQKMSNYRAKQMIRRKITPAPIRQNEMINNYRNKFAQQTTKPGGLPAYKIIETKISEKVLPFWERDTEIFEDLPQDTKNFFLGKTPLDFSSVENSDKELKYFQQDLTENKIILINFDNDTFTPIPNIDDETINIIKTLHTTCGVYIDIEETNISYPKFLENKNMVDFLYKNMSTELKDSYLNEYVTNKINYLKNIDNFDKYEDTNKVRRDVYNLYNTILHFYENKLAQTENGSENMKLLIEELKNNSKLITEKTIETVLNSEKESHFNDYKIEEYGIILPEHLRPKYEIKIVEPENIDVKQESVVIYNNDVGLANFSEYETNTTNQYNDVIISTYGSIYNEGQKVIQKYNKQNDDGIKPYNYYYDCLYQTFSYNCEPFERNPEMNAAKLDNIFKPLVKEVVMEKNKFAILYNTICSQTIVVEICNDTIKKVLENIKGTGFIKLFSIDIEIDNSTLITLIKSEFDGKVFDNITNLNDQLVVVSEFIKFNTEQRSKSIIKHNDESIKVKIILHSCFQINDNVNDKMKASQLFDLILYYGNQRNILTIESDKISGFKNRLSKYLTDNGLKKKRYNDGYYYYGIVKITDSVPNYSLIAELPSLNIKTIMHPWNKLNNTNDSFIGVYK